jgi:hypothetical protein
LKDRPSSDEIPMLTPTQCPQGSDRLCPSARCEEGAILLGIVGKDGVVGYVTPQMTIDSDFVRQAHMGRTPEKRFRFSQPCIENGCLQWTGSRCGVIDHALKAAEEANIIDAPVGLLPKCSIRSQCRWFAQIGIKACAVCALVITDVQPEDHT